MADDSPISDEIEQEFEDYRINVCEHAGHDFAPAGGGVLICIVCRDEAWEDEV